MEKIGLLSSYCNRNGIGSRYTVNYNNSCSTKKYDMVDCYQNDVEGDYTEFKEQNDIGISSYFLNSDRDDETRPYFIKARDNPNNNYIIVGKEVCGFKRVKFENGEFGFVRVSDDTLMPYRFEVADDFNKYGLALVARDGVINYIDTNFQVFEYDIKYKQPIGHYLLDYWISCGKDMYVEDFKRELFPLRKKDIKDKMSGFDEISCFIEGDKPFAIIGEHFTERSVPISPSGELVTFRNYYDHDKEESVIPINGGRLLTTDNGAIMFEDGTYNNPRVYFSNGTYMTLRDIIKFSNDLGLYSILDNCCEEKNGKSDILDEDYRYNINYFRNHNINYMIIGNNEVISIVEWVNRMISLKEFQDCLSRLPNGYEIEEVTYTKTLIHPR